MQESELSKSLKFALFLLGLFSVLPLVIGVLILMACLPGFIFVHQNLDSAAGVRMSLYKAHFTMAGAGISLYLIGRMIVFLGSVVREASFQLLSRSRLKDKLCDLGMDTLGLLSAIGVIASSIGVIDNVVRGRSLEFYKEMMIWAVIIILSQIAQSFLRKQITNLDAKMPDE